MAYQNVPGGGGIVKIGPSPLVTFNAPAVSNVTIDAANEAIICFGRMVTSDAGSHTIDTTGSSSIGWRAGSVTFANAGTTVKVGIAPLDTATGPAARASNTTDVINFDVSADLVGGGGGITANTFITSVPTTGTKTIANGDLVAVCVQMTARGGTDSVNISGSAMSTSVQRPGTTSFTGAVYTALGNMPNFFITFSDGATGWIAGSDIFSTQATRTWNSGSATKEYGQLFSLPFPVKIIGAFGWINPSADTDVVLYSSPLATPVAEKTLSMDANVSQTASVRYFLDMFASAYSLAANTAVAIAFKPGASSITVPYKILSTAGHRVSDMWGTSGYGVSRASGDFSDDGTSLNHYYIGLICSAFDDGAGSGGFPVLGGPFT